MTSPRIDSTTMLDEKNNAVPDGLEIISLDPSEDTPPVRTQESRTQEPRTQEAPKPAPRTQEAAPEGPTPEQEAEAAELAVQVAAGITYTDTFTLRDALKSYNASKVDLKHPETGEVLLSAAAQHANLSEKWFAKRAGKFKLRRPSFQDLMAMRCRIAEFTRGVAVDPDTTEMLTGMAVCEQLLLDAPAWFDVTREQNGDVVRLILHWHRKWSDTFRDED